MRTDILIVLLLAVVVLGPFFWIIKQGSDMIEQDTQACAASGGILVKTRSGFACVEPR